MLSERTVFVISMIYATLTRTLQWKQIGTWQGSEYFLQIRRGCLTHILSFGMLVNRSFSLNVPVNLNPSILVYCFKITYMVHFTLETQISWTIVLCVPRTHIALVYSILGIWEFNYCWFYRSKNYNLWDENNISQFNIIQNCV